MNLTIALAQIDPVLGDLSRNIQKHCEQADAAAAGGANMVVFPELSLTGYTVRDMNWELAVNVGHDASRLAPLIEKSKSISILAGLVEEGPDLGLYNAAVLFEDGKARTVHRKVHLPTYGMFEEMRYFSAGSTVRAFDCKHGRMGVLICEDLWHMSLPYILAQDGARMIAVLVASPTRVSGQDAVLQTAAVNRENHTAYARLLSTYVAFCNRVGYEDGVNFWGGSAVIGPEGDIVSSAKLFDEDLIIARVEEDEVRRARRFSRHVLDENPELVMRELQRLLRARS